MARPCAADGLRLNLHTLLLTVLAMLAFAGNSLLCRLALRDTGIDPASFTSVRIFSGATVLVLIILLRDGVGKGALAGLMRAGSWRSALALFAYAAAFSYAYVSLPAATGALLLFGAVQATMMAHGFWRGERLGLWQWLGWLLAGAGLLGLLLPGVTAPPWQGSLWMLAAGVAWAVYSLRGLRAGDASAMTAGNFVLALPPALLLSLATLDQVSLDLAGLLYAVASGAVTSGIGYAIWYRALPALAATTAATVQLSVPAIAAAGGVLLLAEPMTLRLWLASATILGGIAMVILLKRPEGMR